MPRRRHHGPGLIQGANNLAHTSMRVHPCCGCMEIKQGLKITAISKMVADVLGCVLVIYGIYASTTKLQKSIDNNDYLTPVIVALSCSCLVLLFQIANFVLDIFLFTSIEQGRLGRLQDIFKVLISFGVMSVVLFLVLAAFMGYEKEKEEHTGVAAAWVALIAAGVAIYTLWILSRFVKELKNPAQVVATEVLVDNNGAYPNPDYPSSPPTTGGFEQGGPFPPPPYGQGQQSPSQVWGQQPPPPYAQGGQGWGQGPQGGQQGWGQGPPPPGNQQGWGQPPPGGQQGGQGWGQQSPSQVWGQQPPVNQQGGGGGGGWGWGQSPPPGNQQGGGQTPGGQTPGGPGWGQPPQGGPQGGGGGPGWGQPPPPPNRP